MISSALLASPHRCLGQQLVVPTVGQALLLEGLGVWPQIDPANGIDQQISDLVLSVGLLTRSWEAYQHWIGGWAANRFHRRLWKQVGRSKPITALLEYNHWLRTIQKLPAVTGTQQSESYRIGVGAVGHLIVKLAMECAWSEADIKNMSYPVAVWYGIGIDERLQLIRVQQDSEMMSFRQAMQDDDYFNAIMEGGRN